jgi:hypothetical protein
MWTPPEGRWPPVYDADGLADVIRDLAGAPDNDRFWLLGRFPPREVFQGDAVRLPSSIPVIAPDGEPVATDDCEHWLVIGNTCDFVREVREVPWTQVIPLISIGTVSDRIQIGEHKAYKHSRQFYVPPWPGGDGEHRFADFTRPVTLHKDAFAAAAHVVARMQYPAWVLLHSCLVRFLARDDGRHEAV